MSNYGEVTMGIVEQLISLIGIVLGGSWLTVIVANRKNKQDDKQEIINQLQEERIYFAEQLRQRDVRIDEVYVLFREMDEKNRILAQEKMQAEWELGLAKRENVELVIKNQTLIEEAIELKNSVSELEQRVTELEKGE